MFIERTPFHLSICTIISHIAVNHQSHQSLHEKAKGVDHQQNSNILCELTIQITQNSKTSQVVDDKGEIKLRLHIFHVQSFL